MGIRTVTYSAGYTLKTVVRDFSTGSERVWNTSTTAFEAYNASNAANYGLTTTEGSPGTYSWIVPVLPASALGYEYQATTYQIAGSSLAVTDFPNSVWMSGFAWDGTQVTVSRALPSALVNATGGLLTIGTSTGQISPDGTGAVPLAFGTPLPTTPTANTIGEAMFLADLIGGRMNIAQGGTTTTITLDAAASSDTNAYVGDDIYLYGGTGGDVRGAGQRRTIVGYNTVTKIATLNRAWSIVPDNTTRFVTIPQPIANVGVWNNAPVSVSLPGSGTLSTYAGGAVAAVTGPVTVGTNTDKTGYQLASNGLDVISVATPSGRATTFTQMVVQLWRRFFRQVTLTSGQLQTFADDGTTVVTTQTVTTTSNTQVVGSA